MKNLGKAKRQDSFYVNSRTAKWKPNSWITNWINRSSPVHSPHEWLHDRSSNLLATKHAKQKSVLADLRTHLPLVVDTKKGSDFAEEEQHQFARLGVEQLI